MTVQGSYLTCVDPRGVEIAVHKWSCSRSPDTLHTQDPGHCSTGTKPRDPPARESGGSRLVILTELLRYSTIYLQRNVGGRENMETSYSASESAKYNVANVTNG
jgi:hypothetical protein